MSENVVATFQRPLRLVAFSNAILAGNTVLASNPMTRVLGYKRLHVIYRLPLGAGGPAAGFPRVRQGIDGSGTFDYVSVLALDPSQAALAQVWDVILDILVPYVAVEWTQGGVGAASLHASAIAYGS